MIKIVNTTILSRVNFAVDASGRIIKDRNGNRLHQRATDAEKVEAKRQWELAERTKQAVVPQRYV